MYEVVLFAVAIYVFIAAANFFIVLRRVVGNSLRLEKSVRVRESEIPMELRNQLLVTANKVRALGFEFSHVEKRNSFIVAVDIPKWVIVLKRKNSDSFAEVFAADCPDVVVPTQVAFISFFAHCDVLTVFSSGGNVYNRCKYLDVASIVTDNVDELWDSHKSRLVDLNANGHSLGDQQFPNSKDYTFRAKASNARHFQYQEQQGIVAGVPENFKFTLSGAIKYSKQVKKLFALETKFKQEKLQGLSSGQLPDIHALEVNAYFTQKAIADNGKLSGWIKLSLFCASAVFFAVLFGAAFSWFTLLALIPVLFFHELGHLVAMRLFGYRDLQMLFVPFGAVVIGKTDKVKPWQEAIVLLAGPVPGIVLAFLAMAFVPEPSEWLHSVILMSLVLNYMNLLPFPPLDGGRLMQLVLYNRSPIFKFIVDTLAIVLFGLAAILFQDSLLFLFTAILVFSAFHSFKTWRLVKAVRPSMKPGMNESEMLAIIFNSFQQRKWLFGKRFETANSVLASFSKVIANAKESACIIAFYLVITVGPVAALAANFSLDSQLYEEEQAHLEERTPEVWNDLISKETSPQAKVDLLLDAADWVGLNDSRSAERYLDNAIAISRDENLIESFAQAVDAQFSITEELGPESKATRLYLELESLAASNEEILLGPIVWLTYADNGQLAIEYLNKAILMSERSGDTYAQVEYLQELSDRYLTRNQQDQAELIAIKASKIEHEGWDNSHSGQYFLADYYAKTKQWNRVLPILQSLIEQTDDEDVRFDALVSLAWIAVKNNELSQAEKYFKTSDLIQKTQNEEMLDSLGVAGRLMLGKEYVKHLREPSIEQIEQQLVLAHRQGHKTRYNENLKQLNDHSGFVDIDWHIEEYEELDQYRLAGDRHYLGLWGLRYEYVLAALRDERISAVATTD